MHIVGHLRLPLDHREHFTGAAYAFDHDLLHVHERSDHNAHQVTGVSLEVINLPKA